MDDLIPTARFFFSLLQTSFNHSTPIDLSFFLLIVFHHVCASRFQVRSAFQAGKSAFCSLPLAGLALVPCTWEPVPNEDLRNRADGHHAQGFRKYSTEAPKGNSLTPIYLSVGLVGAGIGFYRYSTGSATAESPKDRQKAFVGGDQGFVDLKLANIETLSHNTKRLRFEFDDKEAVSGLQIACELPASVVVWF